MSVIHHSMSTSLDELCQTIKKKSTATCMNTIYARRYYKANSARVRAHKLLVDVAKRGRCVHANTLDRLELTRAQIVEAWLKFRQEHEPVGKKQLRMQQRVASWM